MKKDDYIIIKTAQGSGDASKSRFSFDLARAKKPLDNGGLLVGLVANSHYDPKTVEVNKSQIVLNLGPKPHGGVVYGCDLNHLHVKTIQGTTATNGNDFHLFSDFDESLEAETLKGFSKAVKRMTEHGLGFVVDNESLPLVFELYRKSKKWAGSFHAGKNFSKIRMYLNEEHSHLNEYVFLHELAHAVDFYLLHASQELKARWVRLYIRSIKPRTLDGKEVREMFKVFKNAGSVSDWKATFEAEDKAKPNLVLRAIKQAHGVSAVDLNTLLKDADIDTLKGLWPLDDLRSTELNPVITEYATTSVKETLAEALSLFMIGKKLPKSVSSLVEDTIQYAIGQKRNVVDR